MQIGVKEVGLKEGWFTSIMNVCDTSYCVLFSRAIMHWIFTMACKDLRVLL